MTVALTDLAPHANVGPASEYLAALHGGARGYVSLVGLRSSWPRTFCGFAPWDELWTSHTEEVEAASAAELQNAVDARWDLYVACSTFAAIPERGRGREKDVLEVPGVWADLDVKPDLENHFTSAAEVDLWLAGLPEPTLVVGSGSGGRHAYWLLRERLTDRHRAATLLQAWYDYLWVAAGRGRRQLDRVQDLVRILRLPGTVRWPKGGDEIELPRPVELLKVGGPRWNLDELESLAHAAHTERRGARRAERERLRERDIARRRDLGMRGWPSATVDDMLSFFDETQDWEPLLVGAGWRLEADRRGEDGSGACRYWVRPGKERGKSASTDFGESRVMVLYSQAPEVAHLVDHYRDDGKAVVTKHRFAAATYFEGDEGRLLRAIYDGGGAVR